MSRKKQIVPGLSLNSKGQATVDSALSDVLFDLAVKLEEPTNLPVDVEHVLAAIVMASRQGKLDSQTTISADDPALITLLESYVKAVFTSFGGKVGKDDD